MSIMIKPADLSKYECFSISDRLGNHVRIMVKGEVRTWRLDGQTSFTISLKILGDFGCYEHFWSHAGGEGETWWGWLHSTDKDYFMQKLVGSSAWEFDWDTSIKEAIRVVREWRKDGTLSRSQAQEIMDQIRNRDHDTMGAEGFCQLLSGVTYETPSREERIRKEREDAKWKLTCAFTERTRREAHDALRRIREFGPISDFRNEYAFSEYYEMTCTRMKPRLVQFWDTIWRPFIEQAKATEGFKKEVAA